MTEALFAICLNNFQCVADLENCLNLFTPNYTSQKTVLAICRKRVSKKFKVLAKIPEFKPEDPWGPAVNFVLRSVDHQVVKTSGHPRHVSNKFGYWQNIC